MHVSIGLIRPTDTITAKTDTITAKTDTITAKTDTITAKTGTITAKTDTITAKTDTITAKTDTITAKTDTITAKTDTITAKTGTITAKTDTITAKTDTITAKTDTITAYELLYFPSSTAQCTHLYVVMEEWEPSRLHQQVCRMHCTRAKFAMWASLKEDQQANKHTSTNTISHRSVYVPFSMTKIYQY